MRENLNVLGQIQKSTKLFPCQHKKELQKLIKRLSVVTVSYKIKLIGSARFMATSLSNVLDNLAEGIQKIKCKDCDCFVEYESAKNNLIKNKRFPCNKDYLN